MAVGTAATKHENTYLRRLVAKVDSAVAASSTLKLILTTRGTTKCCPAEVGARGL